MGNFDKKGISDMLLVLFVSMQKKMERLDVSKQLDSEHFVFM